MEQFMGPQIQAGLDSLLRLAIWLTFIVVIFVPIERLFAAHQQKLLRKQFFTDLGYYFINGCFTAALLSVPISILALFVRNAIPESFLAATAALPLWARGISALVVGEIGYYWGHRLSHEIPFLWRFHAIHHSAEQIDFLVNTRAHPLDMVFGRFCGLVPIYVLGLGGPIGAEGSMIPILVNLMGTMWGYFIHGNLNWRFGPLEWLISTPAFHHWHHTKTPINRNYASTLPWLDLIFGTYHLPRNEFPSAYGIKAKMPESLLDQLAYPLDPEPPVRTPVPAIETSPAADSLPTLDESPQSPSVSSPVGETVAEESVEATSPN